MRALPRFLQYPLTVFTGKPLPGQSPLKWTPTFHLAAATANVLAGVAVSLTATALGGWWLLMLAVGWAATLHGLRNLRMMVYHQCSHRNMYRRPRLDTALGRTISGMLLIQNFARYSSEHVSDHHAAHHMTLRDPTVQAFLIALGLHPGMTRRQMWRRLVGKLLSPGFHAAFAVSRARSFWHGSANAEKAGALSFWGLLASVAAVTGSWAAVLIAWLIPLLPLFQVSNTLRLCVKHTFPPAGTSTRRGREYFASLTNAVFIGQPAPRPGLAPGRRALAWAWWTLRMLCLHAPSRYLVLTGDTVVHDFHHRHPASREWADYLFARERDVQSGCQGWPEYREVWGLIPAINYVFDSLSTADAAEYDAKLLRSTSRRELFAAFDD